MIYIDKHSDEPYYKQIYDCFVKDILDKTLPFGSRLSSSRELSMDLSVSRNTVNRVYQQLIAEGYVTSKVGSGIYVNKIDAVASCKIKDELHVKREEYKLKYDFAYGNVDNRNFPYSEWRRCINYSLNKMELERYYRYPDRTGTIELKNAICDYLSTYRGVVCDADSIVITSGYQVTCEMIGEMIAHNMRGCCKDKFVAFENPGYEGVSSVLSKEGYHVIPVSVDKDGISTEELSKVHANLLYLTPAHQFPMGAVLPINKRIEIIKWAKREDAYIIEDDYDSELRYGLMPIPSMKAYDQYGRVIYTGTFSKCLSATLRVSYMVIPDRLRKTFNERYGRYNCVVSTLIQYALAEFMNEGYFVSNIKKLRTYYGKVQDKLIKSIIEVFGTETKLYGMGAGLHILVDFGSETESELLIKSAAEIKIGLYSVYKNYISSDENMDPGLYKRLILMGYGTIDADKIEQVLVELRDKWNRDNLINIKKNKNLF